MIPKFPELEEQMLKFWRDNKIFQKTLAARKGAPRFVFFEGPPTANGKPGIHHVLARAFKDVILRFKTMQGFLVERRAGWDTHGLPVELQVEKSLGLKNKKDIEAYGIKAFNQKCRESVWQYQADWEKLTERIAFWLDMDDPYVTYENDYIESLWWIFKQIWDKGLVYQDYKIVPYCTRCGTALSSHEMAQGYHDVTEPSVYVKFPVIDQARTYILAWTTTPWTLPGNVALAVGEKLKYVKIKVGDEFFILAKERLEIIKEKYEVINHLTGHELLGLKYQPLYPIITANESQTVYEVVPADFVTTTDGTGVVHTAVMYGEDDFQLGKKLQLPATHTVDEEGKFKPEVTKWAGQYVKDAEAGIRADLKERGLLYQEENYTHSYPHCWRCDTPLLYYAQESWYLRSTAIRDVMITENQKINWVPEHIKEGRFGEWLANIKDWAISRRRYWGTPLPVWLCQSCDQKRCVGSRAELGVELEDLHRPYIDEVILKCECGGDMIRVQEILDVWFDSGAMPWAQWHYPFANQSKIADRTWFPADYIVEAIDQTRGWFYTLLAVSVFMGYEAPYKNVICLGHINDKDGKKMSKSKGNIVEPWEVINQYGADALRWHLYTVNQPGEPKNFDVRNVNEVVRRQFILLWNIYTFWQTFQTGDHRSTPTPGQSHLLDQWIVSELQTLIKTVSERLESYDVFGAARPITEFIEELSVWYVRRSRDRVKVESGPDKQDALNTLHYALLEVSKLAAPFTPFLSDVLYRELGGKSESVHLEDWPKFDERLLNAELISSMNIARHLVELGLAARAEAGIKIRQPLARLVYQLENRPQGLTEDYHRLIADELNVKEVTLLSGQEPLTAITKEEYGIKAVLDLTLTPELEAEGYIREMVRQINSLRKTAKLTLADRIIVHYRTADVTLQATIGQSLDSLKMDTLSDAWVADDFESTFVKTLQLNSSTITLALELLT